MNHKKDIDIVILCGGKGTRLREETETKPKPMIEIGGKPIIWHIMKYYSHYGFNRFILTLGYKGEHIKDYFKNHNLSEDSWEVICVPTGLDTLKGARVKKTEPYVKSPYFHLTYGDGLSTIDLNKLEAFHGLHGRVGTVSAVHPPSRFGEMELDGDYVKEFEEKPQLTSGFINGGFFVFDRKFFQYLTEDESCDLEFGVLQQLSRDRQLMAYRHEGYWQCMDTARDRDYLNKLWESGDCPWKVWKK